MKKDALSNKILFLVFFVGLSLLLYPTVSNYWNSLFQTRAVARYTEKVASLDNESYEKYLDAARKYNEYILTKDNRFLITEEEMEMYQSLLNLSGDGVMGYIEIPSIDCALPIYHGVDESVLQVAVGHIEWSSLPVGGASTHCVVSGHRGLPSARLFTDLDQLAVGDTFLLQVLSETLTYEIDQILIVEPLELDALNIVEGEDYCTLVTCTPYGINTHRLLVRGHRIDTAEEARVIRVTADASQIEPIIVAPVVAAPMLLILLIALMIPKKKKRQEDGI